jgi:hypothetical protein
MAQSPSHKATTTAKTTNAAASSRSGSLTPANLKTEDLNYGDDVRRIYAGDFEHVSIKPDGVEFGMLVGAYMKQYSLSCDRYLPKNKVEIMTQECAEERVVTNGYGVVSKNCIEYRTVGTGRYADPQVYSLQKKADAEMAAGMMGDLVGALKNNSGDPGGMKRMTDVATYVSEDMQQFLKENACDSAAVMRFQANMLRFGENKEPIKMAGGAEAIAAASASGLTKGQSYQRLLDDLIVEESRAWAMNRYEAGSVRVNGVNRTPDGQPTEITGGYSYNMLGQDAVGYLRLTFRDGVPECMYFSDFPGTCRTPSPRVIAAYNRDRYADATAPAYGPIVQEAKVRPASSIASTERSAGTMDASIANRQAMIRPDAPFQLVVNTMDLINDTNVGSGEPFRARVAREVLLHDAVVTPGATVYMKVGLQRRSMGSHSALDLYNIAVEHVMANGRAIPVSCNAINFSRTTGDTGALRRKGDQSAIEPRTLLEFNCRPAANR